MSGFVFLNYSNYVDLLRLRDEVVVEYNAMGDIVLTANMQVHVLMKNVLEKKKRAIARIDASVEGQQFLGSLVEQSGQDVLPKVLRRLRTGDLLNKKRQVLNRELFYYQKSLNTFGVTDRERRMLLLRFIGKRVEAYNSIAESFFVSDGVDSVDGFVFQILGEELVWLSETV